MYSKASVGEWPRKAVFLLPPSAPLLRPGQGARAKATAAPRVAGPPTSTQVTNGQPVAGASLNTPGCSSSTRVPVFFLCSSNGNVAYDIGAPPPPVRSIESQAVCGYDRRRASRECRHARNDGVKSQLLVGCSVLPVAGHATFFYGCHGAAVFSAFLAKKPATTAQHPWHHSSRLVPTSS
jgi:hypothetical protein